MPASASELIQASFKHSFGRRTGYGGSTTPSFGRIMTMKKLEIWNDDLGVENQFCLLKSYMKVDITANQKHWVCNRLGRVFCDIGL